MVQTNVYSALKVFEYPDRLHALRDGDVPAPVHVRIKPMNHCNHNCWYCAYRAEEMQLGADMVEKDRIPPAKMFEIVDDLIAMDVRAVTFSGGGEPLLYKPLPDVVERLGDAGIKIGCLSNGSNLTGRYADAFAKYGTWIRISVDAWDGESYAASRGISDDAFSILLENIRSFSASGTDCVLGISFIVGKENHGNIAEVCGLFRNAGAAHVKLSAAVVSNDVAENNAYHAPLLERVNAEIARARELEGAGFRIVNHYHALAERFDRPYTWCPQASLLTVIGADQAVYTCQDKAYTDAGFLGSIADVSFRELWFSDVNRTRLKGIDPSVDCRHHCVGHAKNMVINDFLSLAPEHLPFV